MANRTVKSATSVHGTIAQNLIGKIVLRRIRESRYWHEDCFLLTSALVLEKAVDDLKYVGGIYGAKPDTTPFLCLVLKLLQIQPQKEIVYLFIEQNDFKYLRALGAFYLRMTGRAVEIYKKLEPLYNDYRKLRIMDNQRKFSVIHMDEFIDDLLREEKVLSISLPRLPKRQTLDIEVYKSELEEQNLIPTQLIEEKIELQRSERERRGRSPPDHCERSRRGDREERHRSHHDRHEHRSSAHRDYVSSSSSRIRYDDRYNSDRQTDDRLTSYRDRRRSRTRSRSRSPPDRKAPSEYEKKQGSKYGGGKCRFSREEIANENAIRAKVGLKPLK